MRKYNMSKIKSEEHLHQFLIDDIDSMTEDELDAEFKALNFDVENELGKVNSILEQQSLVLKKKKFSNVKQKLAAQKSEQSTSEEILTKIKEKGTDIKLLLASMMAKGQMPSEFTMAFRDGKDITDEEAEGILEDLIELGVFKDDK